MTVRNSAGESYDVMVAWPDGSPPAAGWPVLYVLDGEDNFAIATLTARRLARAGPRSGVGDGIIVGIEAGTLARRVRDYTPTTPGWMIPAGQPASGLATGGADAFLDLLETRVKPLVSARWRVDATRETMLGHSFGGLLALHAVLTRPTLFNGAIAISPSLWFGNGLIAGEAERSTGSPRILIAEGDQPARDSTVAGADPAQLTRLLDRGGAANRVRFLPLPGQSHGTTMLTAMAPAVGAAFGKVTP